MHEPKDSDSILSQDILVRKNEGIASYARYGLVVFNILFFSVGVFLLSLGLWIRLVPSNNILLAIGTSARTREYVLFMTVVICCTGSFIMLLSLIGCCGSFSNSKYILGTFFMFMVALFFVLFAIIGLTIWLQIKIDFDVGRQLTDTFVNNYHGVNASNIESIAWERIQKDLFCCGVTAVDGYKDYVELDGERKVLGQVMRGAAMWRNSNESDPSWPKSCCKRNISGYINLQACQSSRESVPLVRYQTGCIELVKGLLTLNLKMVRGVTISLIVLELLNFYTLRRLEAAVLGLDDESVITEISMEQSDGVA